MLPNADFWEAKSAQTFDCSGVPDTDASEPPIAGPLFDRFVGAGEKGLWNVYKSNLVEPSKRLHKIK